MYYFVFFLILRKRKMIMKMKVEAIVKANPIPSVVVLREMQTNPLQQTIQLSQIISILVTKIMILPDGIAQVR